MALLESVLYLLLEIAIILFCAALIVWFCRWVGIAIDPLVYKIGTAIVFLLCLIAIVGWFAGFAWIGPPYRHVSTSTITPIPKGVPPICNGC